jgi:soluble lytic murein transglycosylase-like protein
MSLFLLLLSTGTASAGDIWMVENPDGSISFTDSPTDESREYRPFKPRALSPTTRVVISHLPRINRYDTFFIQASRTHRISPDLLKAVCLAESAMNPNAVSHAGAQGLMQIMPQTAAELKLEDPFNPRQSINAGAKYLSQQLTTFGEVAHALAAYNAGPGAVRRYGGVPPYAETQAYVEKVLGYYEHFRTQKSLIQ